MTSPSRAASPGPRSASSTTPAPRPRPRRHVEFPAAAEKTRAATSRTSVRAGRLGHANRRRCKGASKKTRRRGCLSVSTACPSRRRLLPASLPSPERRFYRRHCTRPDLAPAAATPLTALRRERNEHVWAAHAGHTPRVGGLRGGCAMAVPWRGPAAAAAPACAATQAGLGRGMRLGQCEGRGPRGDAAEHSRHGRQSSATGATAQAPRHRRHGTGATGGGDAAGAWRRC